MKKYPWNIGLSMLVIVPVLAAMVGIVKKKKERKEKKGVTSYTTTYTLRVVFCKILSKQLVLSGCRNSMFQ